MTSVEHWRSTLESGESQVRIAGVPWPAYKVIALAIGFAVFVLVGIVTASAAPAVLSGAAVGAVVWLAFSFADRSRS